MLAVAVIGTGQGTGRVRKYMREFVTSLVDGREANTFDTDEPGVFKPDPRSTRIAASDVRDLATLWRVHRALVRTLGGTPQPPPSQVEALEGEVLKTYDRQVAAGWMRISADGLTYEVTPRGAFWMAMKMVFPIRQVRTYLFSRSGRRKARALLQAP
jgi:hypothetical protein